MNRNLLAVHLILAGTGFVLLPVVAGEISLNEALDNDDLEFTTDINFASPGRENTWYGTTEDSYDEMDSARSLALTDPAIETNFRMSTSFEGPGLLDFIWRVESENDDGVLWFSVSNNETSFSKLSEITGNTPWTPESFNFGPGMHQVDWHVNQDFSSFGVGEVVGYVDQVVWSVPPPPWDLQMDGKVDALDLQEYLRQYHGNPPSEGAQSADLVPPPGVDSLDLVVIMMHWEE